MDGRIRSKAGAIFKIYPHLGSRPYFQVHVFDRVKDLRSYAKRRFGSPSHNAIGWCSSYGVQDFDSERRRWVSRPIYGEILFWRRRIGTCVVSHECAHAAFGFARRRGLDLADSSNQKRVGRLVSDDEERFCLVQGELVRQIYIQLFARGYLKESAAVKR